MKQLELVFENCYGIPALRCTLNFRGGTPGGSIAIYAANGSMKSSFAQTFADVANGSPSRDRVVPSRVTTRSIKDETGVELGADDVIVFDTYNESLGPTEKSAVLLVAPALRAEFEALHADVDEGVSRLLTALKTQSKSRKNMEEELSVAFTGSEGKLSNALLGQEIDIRAMGSAPFADLPYDTVFNDRVLELLERDEVRTAIAEYVTRYNELLDKSVYFRRGTFNYYNAGTVAKALDTNGFFSANHRVTLSGSDEVEVSNVKELEQVIQREKDEIAEDPELRASFDRVETELNRHVDLRKFKAFISDHPEILPELADMKAFRGRVWMSYLKVHLELYLETLRRYREASGRMLAIQEEARGQSTLWEGIVEEFNARFFVPFKLEVRNQVEVMLGQDDVPTLGFKFEDRDGDVDLDRTSLMQVLSNGEKKALYILNILFEVGSRRASGRQTLYVFDDIADSFDYRNKYAIIQYLQDIHDDQNSRLIVLTHNFDFFRTVQGRFVGYPNCLVATRSAGSVSLSQANDIQNPFINRWKPKFFEDGGARVACIPFLRNMLEYARGSEDNDYTMLTSLLHHRPDSDSITEQVLDKAFCSFFAAAGAWPSNDDPVTSLITAEAERFSTDEGSSLEGKIVLSIAIRLTAERFMVQQIDDSEFWHGIDHKQTECLFGRYRELFPEEEGALRTLQRVRLMVPENIHLNSFMYEPILDMSDEHLRRLYRDVVLLES